MASRSSIELEPASWRVSRLPFLSLFCNSESSSGKWSTGSLTASLQVVIRGAALLLPGSQIVSRSKPREYDVVTHSRFYQ
jgi:hypothetical protein